MYHLFQPFITRYKQTNRCFKITSPIRRGFYMNTVGLLIVFHEDYMVSVYETGELHFELLEKKPVGEYFQCEEGSWFFPQVVYVLLLTTAAFCCYKGFMLMKTKWKHRQFIKKSEKKVKSVKSVKSVKTQKRKTKTKSQKSRKSIVQKSSPNRSRTKSKLTTNATSLSKSKIGQSSKTRQHKSLKPNPSSTSSKSKSKTPITTSSSS